MTARLLKVAVVVPNLVISALLALVIGTALPSPVVVIGLAARVVISVTLATGAGEELGVRLMVGARQPTPEQCARLAAPMRLVAQTVDPTGIRLKLGPRGATVCQAGRRQILLDPAVVDAYRRGRLSDLEVAALLAHAIGRLRNGQARYDLLFQFWTLPWDAIRALFVGAGHGLSRIPFGPFAWKLRIVVGAVAGAQAVQAGHPFIGAISAGFVALTYLMPAWRRKWDQHVVDAADQFVVDHGFGGDLVRLLRRYPADTALLDRIDRLESRPPVQADSGYQVVLRHQALTTA